ncbi:hypothetical protein HO173_005934 [Letharia columbiana]|uniref:Uncharacterized protein n=1 Tax=Letharia columbiana TaxID=112416 RepID=A0A8H6FVY9_9LECA|nr:uncharacterized protein HO173_005934 [Letharia columbiana]KAF6235739.1 hypothetical protein HO173_005934 [Letharia columbiana]
MVNWEVILLSLRCIEESLLRNPFCSSLHSGEPKPFYHFTFFAGYQKEANSARVQSWESWYVIFIIIVTSSAMLWTLPTAC